MSKYYSFIPWPLLLFSLIGIASSQGVQNEPVCAISGVVKSAFAGTPVPAASITARPVNSNIDAVSEAQRRWLVNPSGAIGAYSVVSDRQGRFCFETLGAGNYNISGTKRGFLETAYGAHQPLESGSILTLDSGKSLKGLALSLFPQGTVSGRVLDADNEPVDSGFVQILSKRWARGAPRLMSVRQVQPNDLGEFRIANLQPGIYYVVFQPVPRMDAYGGATRAGAGAIRAARTFYPSASRASEAVPIQVKPGEEVPGVDVRMRSIATHQIRGKIVGLPGRTDFAGISIAPEDEEPLSIMAGPGNLGPDDTFSFPETAPGVYRLTYLGAIKSVPVFARGVVTVGDEDVIDAKLEVSAPLSVKGTIRLDGMTREINPSSVHHSCPK